jgi:hypothetical protein
MHVCVCVCSVTTIYMNKLALRTFLKHDKPDIKINFAGASRKIASRFDVPRYILPHLQRHQPQELEQQQEDHEQQQQQQQ